jgi:chorismate lyase/3-hydroxybenzoate synthase
MTAKSQATFDPIHLAASGPRAPVTPPVWAEELVADARVERGIERNGELGIEIKDASEFAFISARLPDAVSLGADALERRVAEMYGAIAAKIQTLASAKHPVRLWNHIPDIHRKMDDRRDRYMVFNAGRYRAFSSRYGGPGAFDKEIATASGIGHDGKDLIVHCLCAKRPGVPASNPRQIPPHRYSARYGPLPPCFARATVLSKAKMILVGGTASIRGEDSLHAASLPLQLLETLTNLASVVEAASAKFARAKSGARRSGAQQQEEWLGRFRDVRVYYPRPADRDALETMVHGAFDAGCRIEMRRADLCRAELLVEIEGVASLAH